MKMRKPKPVLKKTSLQCRAPFSRFQDQFKNVIKHRININGVEHDCIGVAHDLHENYDKTMNMHRNSLTS